MIKINLALKKSSGVSSGAPSSLPSVDLSQLNTGPVRVLILSVLAIFGTNWAVQREKDALMQGLNQEEQQLGVKKKELQTSLSKTKQYDELKKALEADEKVISTKLETIMKLSEDRDGNVKTLQMVSQSIPAEVWLQGFKYSSSEILFKGGALDFNQVSDFTKKLSESELLAEVQQDSANNGKDDRGAPVVLFELTARRK